MKETRMEFVRRVVHLCAPDVCSEWPFSKDTNGAAQVWIAARRYQQAHRYAWELVNGPIPEGSRVHHLCDNLACFNPHHLSLEISQEKWEETPCGYLEKTAPVCTPDKCVEWPFARRGRGYGYLHVAGKFHPAHRYAWELVNGPIPPGLFACHKCDNPPCFNPHHIFLGTQLDNVRDKVAKGRHAHGEKSVNALLTEVQVREILRKYQQGIYTQQDLGQEYGVSGGAIHSILVGKTWKRISGNS
jgi:hypothetical protein